MLHELKRTLFSNYPIPVFPKMHGWKWRNGLKYFGWKISTSIYFINQYYNGTFIDETMIGLLETMAGDDETAFQDGLDVVTNCGPTSRKLNIFDAETHTLMARWNEWVRQSCGYHKMRNSAVLHDRGRICRCNESCSHTSTNLMTRFCICSKEKHFLLQEVSPLKPTVAQCPSSHICAMNVS
jgi:hypothetical protein